MREHRVSEGVIQIGQCVGTMGRKLRKLTEYSLRHSTKELEIIGAHSNMVTEHTDLVLHVLFV